LAASLALLCLPDLAVAQFDGVRSHIQRILVDEGIPSIAVAVARDGEIIWEEGFGWADRERRVRATEHTMYSLASISKPITATGLMVLVERGAIDPLRPVNDYLGEAKLNARVGDAADATVRRVASHTAGLPLHYQFFYEDEPYPRPPMDETIRRYANLVAAPGERYKYSNLGYGILDYVIYRVSGKSYPDFMREEVFLPLGMTRTSVDIGPGLAEYQAIRYAEDGTPIPFYDFDHPGGSAVYSSAHDLIRFAMFHLNADLVDQRGIISDSAIEMMQQPVVKTGPQRGYGIGWASSVNGRGLEIVSHSGGMGGVSTILVLAPAENVAITVLSNASSRWPGQILREILAVLLPDKAPPAATASGRPDGESARFEAEGKLRGTWRGEVHTYNGDIPFILEIHESYITARLGDQLWTLVNEPSFEDGYLRGRMMGDIGTEDANRRPYDLHLEVKLQGNVLHGSLVAISRRANRVGNALTHWVEVKKQ
jgi:CubicO group peptidase (beta-lactamase class C family)